MATKNEMRDEMIVVVSEMIMLEAKNSSHEETREALSGAKQTLKEIKHDINLEAKIKEKKNGK